MSIDLEPIKARLAKACPGPWVGGTLHDPLNGNCYIIVREDDPYVILATLVPQYGDNYTAVMLLHSRADMDAMVAEIEQLREQRRLDNAEAARVYDFARDKGQALERAAVVAWLRREIQKCGCDDDTAACIERGEHIREEER